MTVLEFTSADRTCLGSADVMVRGWLGPLPSMGWEAPYIEPGWLAYPPGLNSALWHQGPGGDAMCGDAPDCAFVILHIRPGSGVRLGDPGRWVRMVGHLDDPASQTCHFVFDQAWPGPTPGSAAAVEECRSQFVVVEVGNTPAP